MNGKVLIKGGTVLSLDRSVGNSVGSDVLIEDGVITEVGPSLRARGAETVDASDAIVMPGFIDTHRHVWHTLFRHLGRGPTTMSVEALGPHYRADDVYAATLVGLLSAVEAGITTLVDWADLSVEPGFVEAALQAHADVGLRSVYAVGEAARGNATRTTADLQAVVRGGRPANVTFAYGAHANGADSTERDWGAARSEGLRIHAHAGTDPASAGLVAELGYRGVLGPDVTLVHCTNIDARDFDAIAGSKTGVSITPCVEMTNGYGAPPLQDLIDRGIRPGLGVGSELETPGDIFAQMRAANSVQHATLFDLKLAGKGGVPNLLTTRDVIRYATIDGAAAIGLDAVTGSLTPGKRGDVIVLRTDLPNIAPVNDPIGAVVWGMDPSNIDSVVVDGTPLVRDGQLVTGDSRARELALAAHRDVVAAAGLPIESGRSHS